MVADKCNRHTIDMDRTQHKSRRDQIWICTLITSRIKSAEEDHVLCVFESPGAYYLSNCWLVAKLLSVKFLLCVQIFTS